MEASGREWKIAESGRERMGGGGMDREEDSGRERKPEEREEEEKNAESFKYFFILVVFIFTRKLYLAWVITKPNYVICEENQ